MCDSGYRDVDIVITTRELGRMIREAGIDFKHLKEEEFDSPLGIGTGAGVIFGTTGGVMEAALRTVADVLTGEDLPRVDYTEVRGMEYTREAEIEIGGQKVKIAVVHTLKSAMQMLERIKKGRAPAAASAAAASPCPLMPKSAGCAVKDYLAVTGRASYENLTKIRKLSNFIKPGSANRLEKKHTISCTRTITGKYVKYTN